MFRESEEGGYFGLPQRLDVESSGVLLLSTKKEFQSYIAELIRSKTKGAVLEFGERSESGVNSGPPSLEKVYEALVHGDSEEFKGRLVEEGNEGILRHFLLRSDGAPKRYVRVGEVEDEDNKDSEGNEGDDAGLSTGEGKPLLSILKILDSSPGSIPDTTTGE